MRLTLQAEDIELDVDLTIGSPAVTVADVFAAAGLTPGRRILVDGHTTCDTTTPVDALGLVDGTMLVSALEARSVAAPAVGARPVVEALEPVVELVCVAGPGAGSRTLLAPGTFDLCRLAVTATDAPTSPDPRTWPAPGSTSRPATVRSSVFRVVVGASGAVRVGSLAGADLLVDGEPVGEEPRPATWVATGSSVFRLGRLDAASERRRPTGAGGRTPFVRSPRVLSEPSTPAVVVPKRPAPPRAPEPLSFLVMLLPLPVGVALAYFLSPFYLVFVLLSPLMGLGRTLDGKRRVKRVTAENDARWADDLARLGEELRRHRAAVAAERLAATRDLGQLARSARDGDRDLWRSRPEHDDFLRPVVGVGPGRWEPELIGDPSPPDVEEVVAEARTVPMCPVTVDLQRGVALGIVGPRDLARRLASAIVAQLVTEHGPADVHLAAVLDPSAARSWDHLKWLPHLAGGDEGGDAIGQRVATTAAGAEHLARTLVREPESRSFRPADDTLTGPVPVFVVDHRDLLAEGLRCLTSRLPRGVARAVIVADSVDELPAFCTSVATVDAGSGSVTLTDVATGQRADHLAALLPDEAVGREIARALARFTDPESEERATALPSFARLADLVPTPPSVEAVTAAWSGGDTVGACRATLGVTETGPFEVDLVGDGPHALIAGTTGAGKSELLRTMIVSLAARYRPDQVSFVLVDFKGGGAFDAFQPLPHTVGVVTDLDEHLAARALRCLRAELTYREHRLRDAGVSDIVDLAIGPDDEPLPRLLIVVDEFATLAAELPDFLTSLVDVAQRGRSLGIHMVLATQRPSGVVDAKIRANTNLRIALRVQDDNDSIDVIGSADAANLDRRQPGRALARLGAGELIGFQTALVSVRAEERTGPPLRLDPFDLLGHDPADPDLHPDLDPDLGLESEPGQGVDVDAAPSPGTAPEDLTAYVEAADLASTALGLPRPRVPWPDPLPSTLAAEPLLAAAPPQRWATPFGLVDRPDEQCREVAWWRAADGNLLVYGLGPAPSAQAIATVVAGLALRHRPDELHLYALDFVGSLAPLRNLPHVGGYVTAEDDERLLRTVQRLEDELDRRRALVRDHQLDGIDARVAAGHDLPLVVLAVANYGAVIETFEELGELGGGNRLARIVRDGPGLGVVVFIAAGSERDVPGRVAQQIEARFLTRMADPNAYLLFGLRPRDVPELGPGRAIDARTQLEVQIAQFGDGDLRAAVDAARSAGSASPGGGEGAEPAAAGPAPVETLGATVPAARVVPSSWADGPVWHLAVALGHERLDPVGLDLRNGQHVMVAGPPGSGRTSALRALAVAARLADPAAVLAVVTDEPEAWDDLRHELDLRPIEYLMAPESGDEPGRRALILVDDVEGATVPVPVFDNLAAQPPAGIHLAVAGRPETFRMGEPWVRAVAAARTGIALRPSPEIADLFRCRFAPAREPGPTGRGHVVHQGRAELGQVVWVDRVASPEAPDGRPTGPSGQPGAEQGPPRPDAVSVGGPIGRIDDRGPVVRVDDGLVARTAGDGSASTSA